MSEAENKIYSYHTFVLPFTWKMPWENKGRDYYDLKWIFELNDSWVCTDFENDNDLEISPRDNEDLNYKQGLYKQYQYFYPNVRKAIFGCGGDVCTNYEFEKAGNNGEYHIIKGEKHYILHIQSIMIRLINTGVGLFIMECENHGKDGNGNPQTDIESIKDINDYGRRITLPYISSGYSVCADQLILKIPGIGWENDESREDFKKTLDAVYRDRTDKKVSFNLNHMCGFIKDILSYGSNYEFVSTKAEFDNQIQLLPVLDDRMYVAYAVCDKEFIETIRQDRGSQSLYECAYIDHSEGCSCPDDEMRKTLLDKAIYSRWLPDGTVYTMTEMGFGMVSTAEIGGEKDYLYENFLACYLQMVYLVIAQKASIVKFSNDTTEISGHFAENGRWLKRDDIRKIMNLQERHAAFDSQILFDEVSPEQQATEMYGSLKEVFKVETSDEKLDQKLTGLYEITDTDLNISVNTGVGVLTWVSIILSVGALLYNIFFAADVIVRDATFKTTAETFTSLDVYVLRFLLIMLVLSLVASILVRVHNRRR